MSYPVIGLYGAGNMARAIIEGLLLSGWPASAILACRRDSTKLRELAQLGIVTTTDGHHLARSVDLLVLGVKPWQIEEACHDMKPYVQPSTTIVSLAAGILLGTMTRILANNWVVRTMPNTPVAIGKGVTAIYSDDVDHPQSKQVVDIFGRVGLSFHLQQEEDIHAVVALSGSGPAYYFHIMALMQRTAQQFGMDEDTARLLASHTCVGAGLVAQQGDTDLSQLRDQVISKGGTTEAAMQEFDQRGLDQSIEAGLIACRNKSQELGQ